MARFSPFLLSLGLVLLGTAPTVFAQDEPIVLDPDVTFDPNADFGFDDDIFAGAFDEDTDVEPSWLDDKRTQALCIARGDINGWLGRFARSRDF